MKSKVLRPVDSCLVGTERSVRARPARWAALGAAAIALVGCTGEIGHGDTSGSGTDSTNTAGTKTGTSTSTSTGTGSTMTGSTGSTGTGGSEQ